MKDDISYVVNILGSMRADQKDHLYCQFGEAYSDVSFINFYSIPTERSDTVHLFLFPLSFSHWQYRKVISGWIMDVGEYFNLHSTTTHAAVAYLDRLQLTKFSKNKWQMLAISCILISGLFDSRPDPVLALTYCAA